MSSKPKGAAPSDRNLVRERVVGDMDCEAGRIVVVRVGDRGCPTGGHASVASTESEVGRFLFGESTYSIRVFRNDRTTLAPGDPSEDLAVVLTVRELEIAALLSRGRLNKQIASALHISEHTVSTYLNRIFSKLGVHSRSAVAARYAAWMSRGAAAPT